MPHDIFISYSSKQKNIADDVCNYLEDHNLKCWMAPRDIPGGMNYGDWIFDAILDCKVFILVFSKAASLSPWVNGELHRAFSSNKPIILFRIDETQVVGDLDLMLNRTQWIDAPLSYEDKLPDLLNSAHGFLNIQEQPPLDYPIGTLKGLFSISPKKKVYFSKGNLQYQASTGTWRFAERQYDVVGSNNNLISSYNNEWIDLFGWGTGNSPTRHTASNKIYWRFVDWGSNGIVNGGNRPGVFRTLTIEEWWYLVSRKGLCVKAVVNDMKGLLLLPDDWNISNYPLVFEGDYSVNLINKEQWEDLERRFGVAFLPAAGLRIGRRVYNVGSEGCYWTSTKYEEKYDYLISFRKWDDKLQCKFDDALIMGFDDRFVDLLGLRWRSDGFSVRLVYPIN